MTDEKDQFAFQKYESAQVAQNYAQGGDLARANIALLQTPVDDDGRVLLQNDPHYSTPEGIKRASMIYGNQFHEGLAGMTFAQLKDFYRKPLSELTEDARKETEALFDKYSGKKLGEVETVYADAVRILKDPEAFKREIAPYVEKSKLDEIVNGRIKDAKKIKEEYEKVINVRQLLQEGRNVPIERTTRNSLLERLV